MNHGEIVSELLGSAARIRSLLARAGERDSEKYRRLAARLQDALWEKAATPDVSRELREAIFIRPVPRAVPENYFAIMRQRLSKLPEAEPNIIDKRLLCDLMQFSDQELVARLNSALSAKPLEGGLELHVENDLRRLERKDYFGVWRGISFEVSVHEIPRQPKPVGGMRVQLFIDPAGAPENALVDILAAGSWPLGNVMSRLDWCQMFGFRRDQCGLSVLVPHEPNEEQIDALIANSDLLVAAKDFHKSSHNINREVISLGAWALEDAKWVPKSESDEVIKAVTQNTSPLRRLTKLNNAARQILLTGGVYVENPYVTETPIRSAK